MSSTNFLFYSVHNKTCLLYSIQGSFLVLNLENFELIAWKWRFEWPCHICKSNVVLIFPKIVFFLLRGCFFYKYLLHAMLLLVHKKTGVQRWKKFLHFLLTKSGQRPISWKFRKKLALFLLLTKLSKGIIHNTTFLPLVWNIFF